MAHVVKRLARGGSAKIQAYVGPTGELIHNTTTNHLVLQTGAIGGVTIANLSDIPGEATLNQAGLMSASDKAALTALITGGGGGGSTPTLYPATPSTDGLMSSTDKAKLDGIAIGANNYSLPAAAYNTLGGVKSGSSITSTAGLIPCPIIGGIPYYAAGDGSTTPVVPSVSADKVTDIYISPAGNDSNDGLSATAPIQTLHHLAELLAKYDAAENTSITYGYQLNLTGLSLVPHRKLVVHFAAGTYNGGLMLRGVYDAQLLFEGLVTIDGNFDIRYNSFLRLGADSGYADINGTKYNGSLRVNGHLRAYTRSYIIAWCNITTTGDIHLSDQSNFLFSYSNISFDGRNDYSYYTLNVGGELISNKQSWLEVYGTCTVGKRVYAKLGGVISFVNTNDAVSATTNTTVIAARFEASTTGFVYAESRVAVTINANGGPDTVNDQGETVKSYFTAIIASPHADIRLLGLVTINLTANYDNIIAANISSAVSIGNVNFTVSGNGAATRYLYLNNASTYISGGYINVSTAAASKIANRVYCSEASNYPVGYTIGTFVGGSTENKTFPGVAAGSDGHHNRVDAYLYEDLNPDGTLYSLFNAHYTYSNLSWKTRSIFGTAGAPLDTDSYNYVTWFGDAGATYIAAGETAKSTYIKHLTANYTNGGNDRLFLVADDDILFFAGVDGAAGKVIPTVYISNRKGSDDDAEHYLFMSPGTDKRLELGHPNHRWKEVYASVGTINTSDEREKQQIEEIPDALLDVWDSVRYYLFKFNDAVEEKGAEARLHAGNVAQRIQAAFKLAGLDPTKYGFFCHDSWNDSPGHPAGDAYGLRYSEVLAIEAAYQRRRADRMQSQLDDLIQRVVALERLLQDSLKG